MTGRLDTLEAYLVEGCTLLEEGSAGKAHERFQSALAIHADNPDALCGRGLTQLRLHRIAAGLNDLRRAAALGSTAAQYYLQTETVTPKRPWWRYLLAVVACLAVFFVSGFIQVELLHRPKQYVGILGLGMLTAIFLTWKFVLNFKWEGASRSRRYVGVTGWLLLFYITTISEAVIMTVTAMRHPSLGVKIFVCLLSVWGIMTCVLLLIKEKHCVINARIYIVAMSAVMFIGFKFSDASIDFILCRIYVNMLWLLYFFFSKRVRNTYSPALRSSEALP